MFGNSVDPPSQDVFKPNQVVLSFATSLAASSIQHPHNNFVLPCFMQIALVYPLDTIKVRCQANSLGSKQVLAALWAQHTGNWAAFLGALYAGAVPAAALSVLVGAVHYVCFCTTRRAVASLAGANSSSSGGSSSRDKQQEVSVPPSHRHVIVSHGATGTHFMPIDDPLCGADKEQQQLLDKQQQQQQTCHSSSGEGQGSITAAAAAGDASSEAESVQVAKGSLLVNCAAAVITAAITALVESPLELFRHNSQAGQIQGNFLREMWRVSRPWCGYKAMGCAGCWPVGTLMSRSYVVTSIDCQQLSAPWQQQACKQLLLANSLWVCAYADWSGSCEVDIFVCGASCGGLSCVRAGAAQVRPSFLVLWTWCVLL